MAPLVRLLLLTINQVVRVFFPIIVFLNIGSETAIESRLDIVGDTANISGYLGKAIGTMFDSIPSSVRIITLKSVGGLVSVSVHISDIVHNNHMTTIVYDYCYSACAIIFASGERRIAHPNATFLIHGAHIEGRDRSQYTASMLFQLNVLIINRYIEYGVDETFIRDNVTYPQPMFQPVFNALTAVRINLATSLL